MQTGVIGKIYSWQLASWLAGVASIFVIVDLLWFDLALSFGVVVTYVLAFALSVPYGRSKLREGVDIAGGGGSSVVAARMITLPGLLMYFIFVRGPYAIGDSILHAVWKDYGRTRLHKKKQAGGTTVVVPPPRSSMRSRFRRREP